MHYVGFEKSHCDLFHRKILRLNQSNENALLTNSPLWSFGRLQICKWTRESTYQGPNRSLHYPKTRPGLDDLSNPSHAILQWSGPCAHKDTSCPQRSHALQKRPSGKLPISSTTLSLQICITSIANRMYFY